MEIKVLGTGCKKCTTLEKEVKKVIEKQNIEAEVIKVEDIVEIMNFGVMSTPALVIDGKVVVSGRVPSEKELIEFLTA